MKIKKPFVGIFAFIIVLLTMPLGHALMIVMEKTLGHDYLFPAAIGLGFLGLILLILGMLSKKQVNSTLLGLFSGLFVWTGWVEFSLVYYAGRMEVLPIFDIAGEIATKPEYRVMQGSIGFWTIIMIYYFFGTKTGCNLFTWLQKRVKVVNLKEIKPSTRNVTVTTFMEINMMLWTFYLLLLFIYDEKLIGDESLVTHFVAYGSLLLSLYLFWKLLQKPNMGYAIRYAIPTVTIFWNFVEILGRWDVFKEIWVHPFDYATEMIACTVIIILLIIIIFLEKRKKKKNKSI
ncbi:MAG: hypothetical protein CSA38_04135 [Flavobacteriales bacterium]|nr:MAG: hypothetical protein CSA38_04135 [Flavobacteriales bacterium]